MPTDCVIDTHALLWFQEGNPKLGVSVRKILSDPTSILVLPVIALAEACWIVNKGRTNIPSVSVLLQTIDADTRVSIIPLTREIVKLTLRMPDELEMHDRQIIATGIFLDKQGRCSTLLTKDAKINKSGLLPVVWQ